MNEECKHNWVEEYYGTRCTNCDVFYPFGCAPWDWPDDDYVPDEDYDPWSDELAYIEQCGEQWP